MIDKILISDFIQEISSLDKNEDIVYATLKFLRKNTNIQNIGIRIKDGKDYPFYCIDGFSDDFIKNANFIACKDGCGLECLCGSILNKVISSKYSDQSVITKKGSFFTNSVGKLIKNNFHIDGVKIRGLCIALGYESMAMVPIPFIGENIGLIKLNDLEEDKLTLDLVESIEQIANMIGCMIGSIEEGSKIIEKRKYAKKIILEKIGDIKKTLQKIQSE